LRVSISGFDSGTTNYLCFRPRCNRNKLMRLRPNIGLAQRLHTAVAYGHLTPRIPQEETRAAARNRRWVVVLFILASVVLARLEPAAPSVARTSLWIDDVRRGELIIDVSGPGSLVPKEMRWIVSQSDARVDRIVARAGAMVQPDTIILECSDADLLQQLAASKSQLESARDALTEAQLRLQDDARDQRVALSGARADYESAQAEVDAKKPLAAQGIVPALEFRRSELSAEALKVKMDAIDERLKSFSATIPVRLGAERAQVEQMRGVFDRRNEQVAALHVRAGIEGVVQEILVEEGQRVESGMNLARVARPNDLQAQLQIPESQAHLVQIGQTVDVDTHNGIAKGHVKRIDPVVQGGVVRVDVDIDGTLPPGARSDLAVDGTIEIQRLHDVIYTGRPAFIQPRSISTMFRMVGDAEASRVQVLLGPGSTKSVEILSGLRPGDRVILSDTSAWNKYARLRLNN
jgi:HlyD family secretion protein